MRILRAARPILKLKGKLVHTLEYLLMVTGRAVEEDEISKAELVRALKTLASASANYMPETNQHNSCPGEEMLRDMHKEYGRRFDHLMHGE